MADKNVDSKSSSLLHGRFELGRMLGHGMFAKACRTRHVPTGKSTAMKIVGKEKVIEVGMMEVKCKMSIMKMVKHSNVIGLLHEVMASKSKIYFAMELIRGGKLF